MNDANYQKSIHFKDQLLKLLENLDKMSSIFFIQNESSIELLNQSNQLHRGIWSLNTIVKKKSFNLAVWKNIRSKG